MPAKFTLQASAAFVSASALGMATGPALAGLLEVHTSQFGITLNANTLPGWIMAGGWFLFLVWLWLGFKEPSHHDPITPSSHSSDINRGGNEWFKPLANCEDICCLGLCLLLWHCCHSQFHHSIVCLEVAHGLLFLVCLLLQAIVLNIEISYWQLKQWPALHLNNNHMFT